MVVLVYSVCGDARHSAAAAPAQESTFPVRDVAFSPDAVTWRSVAVATSKSRATSPFGTSPPGTRSSRIPAQRGLTVGCLHRKGGPARCCLLCERRETARVPSGRVRAEFAHADGVRAVALSGGGHNPGHLVPRSQDSRSGT